MTDPYIGEIRMAGFNFAPRGWVFCQGELLQIAQNTAVFAILGTYFGGDGRTTFGVPRLQTRAPLNVGGTRGSGPGLSPYQLGELGGEVGVYLIETEMPEHVHTVYSRDRTSAASVMSTDATDRYLGRKGGSATAPRPYLNPAPGSGQSTMADTALSTSGQSQPHDNRQPFLAINFIMNLDGLFPPRS